MRIIAHRGVTGEQLENSKAALLASSKSAVDIIEIDVRKTKDNFLVLGHDATYARLGNENTPIQELTLAQVRQIKLRDGGAPLELSEALAIVQGKTVVVELKDSGSAEALATCLVARPGHDIRVASFNASELINVVAKIPRVKAYILGKTKPLDLLHTAVTQKFYGVGLNFWTMNPLFYLLARRKNMDLYVYTLNNRWLARILHVLYPQVAICTDVSPLV